MEEEFRGLQTSHELILVNSGDHLVFSLEQALAHRACERADFKRKYGIDLADE